MLGWEIASQVRPQGGDEELIMGIINGRKITPARDEYV